MSDSLHIICLDAPSPADYGGAIDIFYKVKLLATLGKKISLHYFDYHGGRNIEGLEPFCSKIYSYKRKTGLNGFSFVKPYIVASRINNQLINNINTDDAPILLEGIHCTGIIPFLRIQGRRVVIRVHNDEATYYDRLASCETNLIRKAYFQLESRLLKKYQSKLPDSCYYTCLSEEDRNTFKKRYKLQNVSFIPCFIPWQEIKTQAGMGTYGLYHGNLSVTENEKAAMWLIKNVFSKVDYPFTIAGKSPSQHLQTLVEKHKNIAIIKNPSDAEMSTLVRDAHLHISPSFNHTGVKLKLLNVLFNGRYCITNKNGVQGSRLDEAVWLAESANNYIELITKLIKIPFQHQEIANRKQLLQDYNNNQNAIKLKNLLY